MAMTNGTLELEGGFSSRSGGGEDWGGRLPVLDGAEPASKVGVAGDIFTAASIAIPSLLLADNCSATRTFDALGIFCGRVLRLDDT